MNKFIIEPEKKIYIRNSYDVVIAGGGIAGVAAAVAAARRGASTLLIEKEYALGGLATIGLVLDYLPLCDGMGNLISTGLAEEMLFLSAKDGSSSVPDCWLPGGDVDLRKKKRYFLQFNAASYILELEKFLLDNGVDLLYDTRIAAINAKDTKINFVIVESKSGREAISCKAVVDATGDADVCCLAGEKTVSLNTNSASGWYFSNNVEGNKLHRLYKPFDSAGEILPEGTERGYAGDDPAEVTAHILESRQMIREHIAKFNINKTNISYPFLIPTFPGFRMTRRLVGELEIDADDRKEYPDSIGLISNWRQAGPVYSIPLRAIQGVNCRNLFSAGRCISSKRDGWDMTRVIPACAITGEAAGTAAALCRNKNELHYQDVQKCLIEQKVKIWLKQICTPQ